MSRLKYIDRLIVAVLLLLLLAVAPAMAQDSVYMGETITLSVEQIGADSYQWELYSDSTANFAVEPGEPSPTAYAEFVGPSDGPMVSIQWKKPGTYFCKITALDAAGCAMNLKIKKIKVKEALPTAVITIPNPDWICVGETMPLEVIFTGTAPWEFTFTDGVTVQTITVNESPYVLPVKPMVPTQYWITSVKDKYGHNDAESDKQWIFVYPKPESSRIYPYEE